MKIDQRLSFREAAKQIFGTKSPSATQVNRIRSLVDEKELSGNAHGTTVEAVAEFMARRSLQRQSETEASDPRRTIQRPDPALSQVYQHSLKQFFLAVMLQRKTKHESKLFQQAVLATQIAIVVAVLASVALSIRSAFPPLSPERAAVTRWLEKNTHQHRIICWHRAMPAEDGRTRMRVQYHYTTRRGKGIDTDRVFTILQGSVVSVDSE